MNDVTFRPDFWDTVSTKSGDFIHVVMIATKPDIIKQAPIYLELKKQNTFVLLGHTGQHYDFNLSGGLEEEFGVTPDFNLNIQGSLHKKTAQIIDRLGDIFEKIRAMGKTAIPYVHGDTLTAMAASNAGWANEFASVHVEAGIRTLTPKKEIFDRILQSFNWQDYYQLLQNRDNWERGSIEPYPEQFNTRCAETATGLHCAPVELVREFLLDEGYFEDRIKVVGNSVYDATRIAEENARNSTIFEKYPLLEKGNFVRFCIHRRENTSNVRRFTVLFESIEKLVQEGIPVLLISLYQTEAAIDQFGLRDRVNALKSHYDHFIYSEVWPYYTDVIAAMKKASCCATDSGSMQEEMNILGVPCVTLRYGSDRSESIIAGANMIAPPENSDLIVEIIKGALNNETMKQVPNLYGENVSEKIVKEVQMLIDSNEPFFRFEHDRLRLS